VPLTHRRWLLAAKRGSMAASSRARAGRPWLRREPVDARFREQFVEAMDEDLNTPRALAVLFDLAHEINRARDESRPAAEGQSALLELADVLGLTLTEPETDMAAAPFIELLITIRDELRAAKQFELSDRVRSGLAELGIALEDKPDGTVWRKT
jgi:cysteinyl-tRNA synthetase